MTNIHSLKYHLQHVHLNQFQGFYLIYDLLGDNAATEMDFHSLVENLGSFWYTLSSPLQLYFILYATDKFSKRVRPPMSLAK